MNNDFRSRVDAVTAPLRGRRESGVGESVELLLSAGADSIDELVALVRNRRTPKTLRASAAWLLGLLRERAAVPALLLAMTESRDPLMVCETMKALSSIRDKGSVRRLIELLRSKGRRVAVRMGAAYALGFIGDRRATSALISVLQDVRANARLRDQVADSLGVLKGSRGIVPLMVALHDPSPAVRASAANSLGNIRAVCALSELKTLTRKGTEPDPLVRRVARWAVARLEEARKSGDKSGKSWRD